MTTCPLPKFHCMDDVIVSPTPDDGVNWGTVVVHLGYLPPTPGFVEIAHRYVINVDSVLNEEFEEIYAEDQLLFDPELVHKPTENNSAKGSWFYHMTRVRAGQRVVDHQRILASPWHQRLHCRSPARHLITDPMRGEGAAP